MPDIQHELLVIQDGTLESMARDARFTAAFPFLAPLATPPKKTGCGRCSRAADAKRVGAFRAAKATIAGLPADKKRELKVMLRARQIRVIYYRPDGTAISLTF